MQYLVCPQGESGLRPDRGQCVAGRTARSTWPSPFSCSRTAATQLDHVAEYFLNTVLNRHILLFVNGQISPDWASLPGTWTISGLHNQVRAGSSNVFLLLPMQGISSSCDWTCLWVLRGPYTSSTAAALLVRWQGWLFFSKNDVKDAALALKST